MRAVGIAEIDQTFEELRLVSVITPLLFSLSMFPLGSPLGFPMQSEATLVSNSSRKLRS
jgi:hypothetical protein